jgi:hypothetical protein
MISRFFFLVVLFVAMLVASLVSVRQATAHGGGDIVVNGVRIRVNGNGGHARSFGGPAIIISGNGGRPHNPPNRFNQNGGVNRFGFRR